MFDIIIVTYNAKDKLKRCIESVIRHTKNYSLTIVDNHSFDGTSRYLNSIKNINIIYNRRNLGFSGAANVAIRKTRNRFIVLLDDDTEVTKNWLTGLYDQMKNNPKVGIVGCKITFPGHIIHAADYRIKPLYVVGLGETDSGQRDYVKECDALIGACWLMRRELVKKVGYFDERFFPSQGEDIDYCLRTRIKGYKIVYNGRVKIIHRHLFRSGGFVQYRKNRKKFLKKWKKLFDNLPFKDSDPIDKHIAYGINYLEKREFNRALIEFKKLESHDNRYLDFLYIYMGVALESLGQYQVAIQYFKKTVKYAQKNYKRGILLVLSHQKLALCYKKMGLIKKAHEEARAALNYAEHLKPLLDKSLIDVLF